ncbi:MAG: pyridoxal-dependent decarboxylase, exosortase A system-associated [Gammaproteobacteria bacterium]|nr:pyridoxal-dependent decarboxylase, exosortase A system-associated [Gammaproteobacteria bacterium]
MNRPQLQHYSPQKLFDREGPHLVVAGQTLMDIAGQCGPTPLYIYSKQAINDRIAALKAALPARVHLHYAVKANPMQEVIDYVAEQVHGLDVSSGNELKAALQSGIRAQNISFAGPGKSLQELKAAIAADITLNVESEVEFTRILSLCEETGQVARVALRINPDFELRASGIKTSGGPQPFGVDAEAAPELLEKISTSAVEFRGFHIFSGSQVLQAKTLIEAHRKTFALAKQLADHAQVPVQTLNIGGGFGIPYFPGDAPLEVAPVMEHLEGLLTEYRETFAETQIILELGRYLVGEAGLYMARITDRKVSRGTTYLVTDGGLHHHLAASGNFGQALRRNYPITIGNKLGGHTETVTVVGPLCTPLDMLAKDMDLPKAEIGDLLVVFQSGAYGYSASPLEFLSHPRPREILV